MKETYEKKEALHNLKRRVLGSIMYLKEATQKFNNSPIKICL